jgi:hypothetical protein
MTSPSSSDQIIYPTAPDDSPNLYCSETLSPLDSLTQSGVVSPLTLGEAVVTSGWYVDTSHLEMPLPPLPPLAAEPSHPVHPETTAVDTVANSQPVSIEPAHAEAAATTETTDGQRKPRKRRGHRRRRASRLTTRKRRRTSD